MTSRDDRGPPGVRGATVADGAAAARNWRCCRRCQSSVLTLSTSPCRARGPPGRDSKARPMAASLASDVCIGDVPQDRVLWNAWLVPGFAKRCRGHRGLRGRSWEPRGASVGGLFRGPSWRVPHRASVGGLPGVSHREFRAGASVGGLSRGASLRVPRRGLRGRSFPGPSLRGPRRGLRGRPFPLIENSAPGPPWEVFPGVPH